MTAKAAKKARTSASKGWPFPRFHRITVDDNAKFKPDPVKHFKHGDFLQILIPPDTAADITLVIELDGSGGSGGPITIHS